MRRRERARRHRRRGVLAHAPDRDPLLARTSRSGALPDNQTLCGNGLGLARCRRLLDVVPGNRAARAGAGQPGEVDAEVPGHLAYGRLGQRGLPAAWRHAVSG